MTDLSKARLDYGQIQKVDILAFGAHPDDIELSAAGTLIKHKSLGYTIGIVDLTQGELGTRGSAEIRQKEAQASAAILGLSVRLNFLMEDGFFEETRETLELIAASVRALRPKVVISNAIHDRHPDHGRGSSLVSRACFLAGLRQIHLTHNGAELEAFRPQSVYHYIQDRYIQPDFVVDISDVILQKFDSTKAYSSQFFDPNSQAPQTPISGPGFEDFLKGRWAEMGRPAGYDFGEGFTVERPLGVQDLIKLD